MTEDSPNGSGVTGHVTPFEEVALDQHTAFEMEFPGGVTASCRTSYGSHDDTYFEVLGTPGRVRLEPAFSVGADRTATLETDAGTAEVSAIDANDLVEEFEYFAYCVETGTTPEPDGHEGVTDLQVMAGVYESADTGRRVDL